MTLVPFYCSCGTPLAAAAGTTTITCHRCGVVTGVPMVSPPLPPEPTPAPPALSGGRSSATTVVAVGAVAAVALAGYLFLRGGNDGPPREQIESDLRNRVPNYVNSACGCIGGPSVDAIKRVSSSSAELTVTNGGMFCPQATCDISVHFRYVKIHGRWEMDMPMQ